VILRILVDVVVVVTVVCHLTIPQPTKVNIMVVVVIRQYSTVAWIRSDSLLQGYQNRLNIRRTFCGATKRDIQEYIPKSPTRYYLLDMILFVFSLERLLFCVRTITSSVREYVWWMALFESEPRVRKREESDDGWWCEKYKCVFFWRRRGESISLDGWLDPLSPTQPHYCSSEKENEVSSTESVHLIGNPSLVGCRWRTLESVHA